jgi:hypothetical protein
MKTYAVKSSAHRAAKQAGLTKEQYEIVEVDGQFGFKAIEETPAKPVAPIGTEVEGDLHDYRCPHCNTDLDNGIGLHGDEVNGKTIKHDQFIYACLACNGEFGPAIPADLPKAEKKAPTKKIEVTNHSTIELPTKRVWHIADEMKAKDQNVRRKDVIAECVRQGVAFYTARTQYQQWLQVQKEMADREATMAAGK